jgi:hypothetical protein
MTSAGPAAFAAACLLFYSAAASAASLQATEQPGIEAADSILARLDTARAPRVMSPLKPVADTCKDKCEDERDKCFNACPSDPNEGSVCRNGCSDTYDACQKGC